MLAEGMAMSGSLSVRAGDCSRPTIRRYLMPWRSPNRRRSDHASGGQARPIVDPERWRSAGVPVLPAPGILGPHAEDQRLARIRPGGPGQERSVGIAADSSR